MVKQVIAKLKTRRELKKRIKEIKYCIAANEDNMERLRSNRHKLAVKVNGYFGTKSRIYYRTPEDMRRYDTTIQDLKIQNAVMKKELELLQEFTGIEVKPCR